MALATSYSVTATLTESSATVGYFAKSVTSVATYTENTLHRLSVPTATTDLSISLGGCSAGDLVFIKTDQTISIKISGGAEAITVQSICVLSAGISALTISNASGATATVDILILD